MSALLSLNAVQHSFRGLSVLRGVSLEVPERSITGLIGPNGAGKSTLFNIVSGFLQPMGGAIHYAGTDITSWSVTQRSRAGLIRTFQTPQVFSHLTVGENLIAAGWLSASSGFLSDLLHLPKSRGALRLMTRKAEEIASQFELEPLWSLLAGDLPAGRQRLVELARAAIASPRLLCLDEPSSGLSADDVNALRITLQRMLDTNMTILLVSHDMDLMAVASSVHVLSFGEIIASGEFGAVKADPRVREAYLGV